MNAKVKLTVLNFMEFAVWGAYLTSMGTYLARVGLAMCQGGSGKHGSAELLLAHCLRTTEGEQYAAGGNLLHCPGVELCISAQRILHGIAMLGKC